MKTLYDVQQLLEKYGILVHVGKRIWDIELMALELDNMVSGLGIKFKLNQLVAN